MTENWNATLLTLRNRQLCANCLFKPSVKELNESRLAWVSSCGRPLFSEFCGLGQGFLEWQAVIFVRYLLIQAKKLFQNYAPHPGEIVKIIQCCWTICESWPGKRSFNLFLQLPFSIVEKRCQARIKQVFQKETLWQPVDETRFFIDLQLSRLCGAWISKFCVTSIISKLSVIMSLKTILCNSFSNHLVAMTIDLCEQWGGGVNQLLPMICCTVISKEFHVFCDIHLSEDEPHLQSLHKARKPESPSQLTRPLYRPESSVRQYIPLSWQTWIRWLLFKWSPLIFRNGFLGSFLRFHTRRADLWFRASLFR